jgi:Protein of unknown function (DUF3800)
MEFTAYLDDSGTHDGSLNVTVAGFVADDEQWKHLDREWGLLLEEFRLDQDPGYFHMAHYESRKGPYATWDNPKRIDFMRKLTGIIKRRVRAGIAASFPEHNVLRMRQTMPDTFPTGYSYMTCAQVCWRNIGKWADDFTHSEDVRSVFEEGTTGQGLILQAHTDLRLNHAELAKEWHLGDIGFDSKQSKPLQAADFFAYETYKRMTETITDVMRWRKSVESVVKAIPIYGTFLNDEATDEIVRNLTQRRSSGHGLVD